MRIEFLQISGPDVPPAVVNFVSGLNVINGPSNTGKSHILRLIDYALGASEPPEAIPEQLGYDIVHLGITLSSGAKKTIIRPLQGGEVRLVDGLRAERLQGDEGFVVSARHNSKKSLSKVLLEDVGAQGAKVRTNATGKTRELSFRDLLKLCIVEETEIQSKKSPVLTGQFVNKTAELSVFKYVLMGVDDSALDVTQKDQNEELKQAAQLEFIDGQIRELDKEIDESSTDFDELKRIDLSLNEQLEQDLVVQEDTEASYKALLLRRRELRGELEHQVNRVQEIETLLRRFRLLAKHYTTDEKRLISIIEAGQFYLLEHDTVCPMCGAAPEQHRPEMACQGDVATIEEAAKAELSSLQERSKELASTITYLEGEKSTSEAQAKTAVDEIDDMNQEVAKEVPFVQAARAKVRDLVRKKVQAERELELVRRKDRMLEHRTRLGVSRETDSAALVAQSQLDGTMLDQLCQTVESELKSWEYQNAQRVFFEVQKLDISVAGKLRTVNGKGVRALLHGAFSVGLLKFCLQKKRVHPRFLILDSLFVTYRDPDDAEDQSVANSTLKDRAFAALRTLPEEVQLIVLENVEVPGDFLNQPFYQHFTGQAGLGRAGLFPQSASGSKL